MAIQLTSQEVSKITQDFGLDGDTPNYAGMYDYIYRTYSSQMDKQQSYWFKEAANINRYLNYVAEPIYVDEKHSHWLTDNHNQTQPLMKTIILV